MTALLLLPASLSSCLLALHVRATDAAKRHPNAISSMEELGRFFATVFALLVLPVLLYSLWSLASDPAARELPLLATQWAKRKLCGFLTPPPPQRGTAVRSGTTTTTTTMNEDRKPKTQ